ncbi:DUF2971 domain-containing protein [Roseomonas sp. CCTCC AB2023176]|uniref:DUF2971 domain-containing protein n=1 Tax=Roseomonas sp. CCTCC AB2023176 TaxID=3342640 RepID=UPI0035DB4122
MDFNDPFDCSPTVSLSAPQKVYEDYLGDLFREKVKGLSRRDRRAMLSDIRHDPARRPGSAELRASMRSAVSNMVNSAGVLSLAARPDQVLLWSHYASAHTGICLRFSRAPWAYPFRAAQKVIYSEQRPVLNPVLDNADAQVDKAILTKADFWAYEEEWRVLSHPGGVVPGGPGLVTFDPKALDAIILGARVSDADVAEVASWVEGREQPVALLRAHPNAERFRIDIVPLDAAVKG